MSGYFTLVLGDLEVASGYNAAHSSTNITVTGDYNESSQTAILTLEQVRALRDHLSEVLRRADTEGEREASGSDV